MKDLGQFLKQARLKNGVSILEASEDLNLSTTILENIELGNIKAFKDIYEVKKNIRVYAKYLGLDVEKVSDQFNGFLFQHTSKISIEDIKKSNISNDSKIKSPYTIPYKRKINKLYIIAGVVLFILLVIIIYFIISNLNKAPSRTKELLGKGINYELTY